MLLCHPMCKLHSERVETSVPVKNADDKATLLLFWDSEADAESANKLMGPTWFATNVAPYLAGPQERSVGEVIVQHQK